MSKPEGCFIPGNSRVKSSAAPLACKIVCENGVSSLARDNAAAVTSACFPVPPA